MQGLNKVLLIGNLGADPELRFTQAGQGVLNVRMACTESYVDRENKRQERTEWVNVTIWGKRAEGLAKVLAKGSPIHVEGSLRTSSYDDREGIKRYKTEVIAHNVLLLPDGKRHGAADNRDSPPQTPRSNRAPHGGAAQQYDPNDPFDLPPPNEDGLPF